MQEPDHQFTGRRQADEIIIRLEQQFSGLMDMMKEVRSALLGDGTSENPGVMIRLDRLEQAEVDRKLHRTIIYTSVIGLAIERIFHYFKGNG